jgi:hypothetical protein
VTHVSLGHDDNSVLARIESRSKVHADHPMSRMTTRVVTDYRAASAAIQYHIPLELSRSKTVRKREHGLETLVKVWEFIISRASSQA